MVLLYFRVSIISKQSQPSKHLKMTTLLIVGIKLEKEMYVKQRIVIKTRVARIGGKSVVLEHRIVSEDGETLAVGESVLVRFDKNTQMSLPLEAEIVEKLEKYKM